MGVAAGREAEGQAPKENAVVVVLKQSVSSRLDDLGSEARPHLPHACCSGEAGHCYPRVKIGG